MATPLPHADIPAETVQRITAAADQLYEENGRSAFPNVDAVRRRARVNMNDASSVMRAWRRAQTMAAAPLTVVIPPPVQEAGQSLLAALWQAASDTANANLQAAQSGWELERAEAEACREQLATAFDAQSGELADAQRTGENRERELASHRMQLAEARAALAAQAQATSSAEARAAMAQARIDDILRRADDLKSELDAVHASADAQRQEAQRRIEHAEQTIAALEEQLRERSQMHASTREELAHLCGQLEALTAQRRGDKDTPVPDGEARSKARRPAGGKTTPRDGN